MRSSFPTPRPRWIAITAAVVSVLAVLALFRVPPTEVSEDDALAAFRDQVAENDRAASETPAASADTTPSPNPSQDEPTPAADGAGVETADDAEQAAEPGPEPADVADEPADDTATEPDEPAPSPTATAPAAPQHTRPQQGVYRFSVDGQESLDVPGGSREHPSSATATIVHQNDGCGWTSTVTLSEERQDTFEFCTSGDGHTMRRVGSYVEFFGQGEQQDFVCAPELDLPGAPSDATTSTTCTDAEGGADANITASFVETGTRTIGGVTVEAVRLQYEVRFSGSMEGRSSIDIWIHGTTGALLWMDRDTDTMVQTQAGRRRYQEQVVVELQDVKPRS